MEHEASEANAEVSSICDNEDRVMTIFTTAVYALVGEVDEHDICQCVDNLGSVVCGIVVL